ncbi:MAG: DUF3347 domain-containing protein [Williamsia sp.]|nr:DUF3347 domain-containing protein [Williamsia sp.]
MRNLSLFFLSLFLLTACGGGQDKEPATTGTVDKKEPVSKNSTAFNASFEKLLTSYYSLRDAFVEYDTAKVNIVSKDLAADAGGVKLDELKGDSSSGVQSTAKDYTATIQSAAGEIPGQKDFTKKQRQFQAVSDAMYELVRTVRYDQEKIYHQHCPMAFDNEGAYWISNSQEIVNPYMGKKHPKYRSAMLECGDIPDSLDFAK